MKEKTMFIMLVVAALAPLFMLGVVKMVGNRQIASATPGQPRYFAMRTASYNYRVAMGVAFAAYGALAWYVIFS